MDLEIQGKVALISASSQGIGKAVAYGLSKEGCKVIICSRSEEHLNETKKEIESKTKNLVVPIQVDLMNKESVNNLIDKIKKDFGRVDILINNTPGPSYKRRIELKDEDWLNTFNMTFMSIIWLTEAFIPEMIKAKWGRIIYITSVAIKQPGFIIANSHRSSVASYAKYLSNELGRNNILVNTVCPSYVITDRLLNIIDEIAKNENSSREKIIKRWTKDIPLNKIATPEELANIVVFLSSEKASYMTGSCILVDGGFVKGVY
ncbi:MAG: SDR family oxidoreductase [Desulfobacterales bacterium]|nr:SDR family oxidoreductase [Desulfobacterales bacterium]